MTINVHTPERQVEVGETQEQYRERLARSKKLADFLVNPRNHGDFKLHRKSKEKKLRQEKEVNMQAERTAWHREGMTNPKAQNPGVVKERKNKAHQPKLPFVSLAGSPKRVWCPTRKVGKYANV